MTDAEVAMACDAWLAAANMTRTIFAKGWPDDRIIWPNAPTTPGVMILPRVEVRYMTIQPQQLTLGIKPEKIQRHLIDDMVIVGGGTARRQFVYVVTLVAKSQGYQYDAQNAADILARHFLFGTRLEEEDTGLTPTRYVLSGTVGTDPPITTSLWVRAPVQTGPGYQDGTEWRVPVTINLETLAKI